MRDAPRVVLHYLVSQADFIIVRIGNLQGQRVRGQHAHDIKYP